MVCYLNAFFLCVQRFINTCSSATSFPCKIDLYVYNIVLQVLPHNIVSETNAFWVASYWLTLLRATCSSLNRWETGRGQRTGAPWSFILCTWAFLWNGQVEGPHGSWFWSARDNSLVSISIFRFSSFWMGLWRRGRETEFFFLFPAFGAVSAGREDNRSIRTFPLPTSPRSLFPPYRFHSDFPFRRRSRGTPQASAVFPAPAKPITRPQVEPFRPHHQPISKSMLLLVMFNIKNFRTNILNKTYSCKKT